MQNYIGLILPAVTLMFSFWRGSRANSFDVFFRYILYYIITTEALGNLVPIYSTQTNDWVYNQYSLIIYLLFIRLFYLHTASVFWKKWMVVFSIILVLVFLADTIIFRNFFTEMQYYPYIVGAVFLIITISSYLYEIINTDRIIYFYKLRSFWVSMGLLLFYVPFIPVLVGSNYDLFDDNIRYLLTLSLNIIMHLCFIISYLWAEKI